MITLSNIKQKGDFKCNIHHLNKLCEKVNRSPQKVYDLISEYGGEADTITREAIFYYIANKYHNGDYNVTYDKWLSKS